MESQSQRFEGFDIKLILVIFLTKRLAQKQNLATLCALPEDGAWKRWDTDGRASFLTTVECRAKLQLT
jgi:hypothetical protein